MKKIISLILMLTIVCAVMLTSCGNKNDSDPVAKIIDVKLTDEEYAFVCKKGNTDLVNSFNAFLTEIKGNGTFNALVDKYFKGEGEKEIGRVSCRERV